MHPIPHGEKLRPFLDRLHRQETSLLVALGDSNTCNADFTRGEKQWPELLHEGLRNRYQTQKILLVNAGVCGDSVREANDRLEADVLRFGPQLTLVALGSNDAKRLTDEEFRAGTSRILDRLDAAGSLVLLLTPLPIMEYEPPPRHLWKGDDRLRPKIAVLRALAAERALPLVDLYAQWWSLEEQGKLDVGVLMHDAVHVNGAGHRMVYRSLAPAFDLPGKLPWDTGAVEE